jgi:DNA-directed RNA polymerase specialized sigma24 family protein
MKVYLTTEDRIRKRREIECLCNIANLLPVHKRIILHLYYRDGYTNAEIGQVIMKSAVTVARRIEHARRDAIALRDGTNVAKKIRAKCTSR